MILHSPKPDVWIEDVQFIPATHPETHHGLLGWVTCFVWGTLRLDPMRVRVRYDGSIRIKVRRGGTDTNGISRSLNDETRDELHGLIEDAEEFQAGLQQLGFAP